MKTITEHLEAIQERVKGRLESLGLGDQLPKFEITRIINDTAMEYWEEAEQEEEEGENFVKVDPETLTIVSSPAVPSHGIPPDGIEIAAVNREGEKVVIGLVDPKQGAFYLPGHRITVEGLRVMSRHRDGSPCNVGCPGCDNPDLRVMPDGMEVFIYCLNCGRESDLYQDKFEAIAAWIVGKSSPHGTSEES